MKHLVRKEHHHRLKKRLALEIFGLAALTGIMIQQRALIIDALDTLRSGDLFYIIILLVLYWVITPLTPISYLLLADKKLSLNTTMLAQVAASGPGRIIPGGLGHLSISVMHLRKSGLRLDQAVVVTLANNVIGLSISALLVLGALVAHPTILQSLRSTITTQTVLYVLLGIFVSFGIVEWVVHVRGTRAAVRKIAQEWGKLFMHLIDNPGRLAPLMMIACVISVGHITMLMLAGVALGEYIAPVDAILALSFGVFLGGALPTPGGFGAVEAGMTSALVVLGYDPSAAISVALLQRFATYWQPLIPGVLSYLYLRERNLL